jgi:4,5-dihydroxyphthalate decarboxylase
MTALALTMACGSYDRTRALAEGMVPIEGVSLRYLSLAPEETFFRMARHADFDVSEFSLSTYTLSLFREREFVAIPVFPSRMFRHSGIYVNASAGITSPEDLIGRTVGIPEYQMTAAVWIRGILAEHHGVPIGSVHYRTGGLHQSGRSEKLVLDLPPEIDVEPCPEGRTLAEMLISGEIDALYSPRVPQPYRDGRPEVRRLFEDFRSAEEAYYAASGVFPIMHTVVIQRHIYEQNRWVAQTLVKAFEAAKQVCLQAQTETNALSTTLPWLQDDVRRTQAVLGTDFWPYGVEANRTTLATFLRYSHEQGLAQQLIDPSELFAPETLDSFTI